MKETRHDSVFLSKISEYICLDSNSASGLTWKKTPGKRISAGKPALAHLTSKGYFEGRFLGKPLLSHRVVFYLSRGYWPTGLIDHINGDRSDNRPTNLRESSHKDNGANCSAKGYFWDN